MRPIVIALVAAAGACAPSSPELPWLYGLSDTVATDREQPGAIDRLPASDEPCVAGTENALQVAADVVGSQAPETVVAAFARGMVVFDAEGTALASAPGYPCGGSADDLAVLAAGRAYGHRMIATVAITGGHNKQVSWIGLHRVFDDGQLAPAFAGAIEERVGEEVHRGWIQLLPEALLYQRPGGRISLWIFDDAARAYVFRATVGTDESSEPPHVPAISAR